jgi:hypothetical protein
MQYIIVCFFVCLSCLSCASKDGKVSADKIETAIKAGEPVYYTDMTISGDLHLINPEEVAMSSPGRYTQYIQSALVFRNCTFTGKIIGSYKNPNGNMYAVTLFKNLFCEKCTFSGDVDMEGATISGYCNFLSCTFKKDARFNRTSFNQVCSYTKCIFEKVAGFQSCTYNQSTFFNESHFMSDCFFQNSYAYRDFTFSLAICDGYADFSSLSFYAPIFCNYAQFNKSVVFSESSFRAKTEFVGTKYVHAEYERCLFYAAAIFDKTIFTKDLILKGSKFMAGKPSTPSYKAASIDISDVEVVGAGKMSAF